MDLGDFVLPAGPAAAGAADAGGHRPRPRRSLAAPAARRARHPAAAGSAGGGGRRSSPTGSYAVDFTGEAVLSLLRFASQILARAVVFAVEGDAVRGIGEFGVQLAGGRSGAEAVRQTVLSLREPSILRAAVERRRTYAGPLEPTRVNLALVERLGGAPVREAVAIPLLVRGRGPLRALRRQRPLGRPARPPGHPRVVRRAGGADHREDPGRARLSVAKPRATGHIVGP